MTSQLPERNSKGRRWLERSVLTTSLAINVYFGVGLVIKSMFPTAIVPTSSSVDTAEPSRPSTHEARPRGTGAVTVAASKRLRVGASCAEDFSGAWSFRCADPVDSREIRQLRDSIRSALKNIRDYQPESAGEISLEVHFEGHADSAPLRRDKEEALRRAYEELRSRSQISVSARSPNEILACARALKVREALQPAMLSVEDDLRFVSRTARLRERISCSVEERGLQRDRPDLVDVEATVQLRVPYEAADLLTSGLREGGFTITSMSRDR